jgi:hypothetical protein
VSRDLALMGALTGQVSLLIKKNYVVWGGFILPLVSSWSRMLVVSLAVLGCVDLVTSFVLRVEGFSCSKS